MTQILYRTAELSAGTGRTVFGLCVPYGVQADVDDGEGPYREQFEYGAFSRSIAERGSKIKLLANHDYRQFPVGKAVELNEQRDGLHASFEIANTRAGDDALELVHSGMVDGFSVGFRGIRHRQVGGVTVRIEAALNEVSLTAYPAYSSAAVAGVRSAAGRLVIPRGVAEARRALMDW